MQFAQDGTAVCLNDVGMMDTQMNTSCTNLNTEDMLNWYDPLCTETDKSYITFSRWRPARMASFTSWAKLSPRLLEILEMYSARQVVYQRIYRYTVLASFTALSNTSKPIMPNASQSSLPSDFLQLLQRRLQMIQHMILGWLQSESRHIVFSHLEFHRKLRYGWLWWLYVTASPQPRWASNQFSEVNHWRELTV